MDAGGQKCKEIVVLWLGGLRWLSGKRVLEAPKLVCEPDVRRTVNEIDTFCKAVKIEFGGQMEHGGLNARRGSPPLSLVIYVTLDIPISIYYRVLRGSLCVENRNRGNLHIQWYPPHLSCFIVGFFVGFIENVNNIS